MKFMFLIAFFFICSCQSADITIIDSHEPVHSAYKDCGSKTGTITSVDITDCPKPPCVFKRGGNYTLEVNFKSNVDSKSLTNHVYGVIAHVPIPFSLPNANGCELGIKCPIKKGENLSESVTLPILEQYPKIGVMVKWKALDDANNEMICFEFPVKLV